VETRTASKLALPSAAVVREGDKAYAWAIREAKLQKAELTLGERDPRSGAYVVNAGINEGEDVLRFPSATLKEGQPVTFEQANKTAVVVEK